MMMIIIEIIEAHEPVQVVADVIIPGYASAPETSCSLISDLFYDIIHNLRSLHDPKGHQKPQNILEIQFC